MVTDPMDGYPEWMASMPPTPPKPPAIIFRLGDTPVARHDEHGHWERVMTVKEKKRTLQEAAEEIKQLQVALRKATKRADATKADCDRRLLTADELVLARERDTRKVSQRAYTAQQKLDKTEAALEECRAQLRAANLSMAEARTAATTAARKLLSRDRVQRAA